jgi:hypothetical protein
MKHFFSLLSSALLAFILLALRLPAAAQAPVWRSARAVAVATAAAATNYSSVTATAVDATGNVYLAGNFTNTVVLGSTTLTSLGDYDVFVAKFNSVSNQFVWVQRAGGMEYERATALAVSGSSVYVAGFFASSTASFGTTTLTNSLPSTYDAFVAKLTDAGSTGGFVWAQRAGGTGDDGINALAVSGTSVCVAGNFASSTVPFGTTTLTSAGGSDVFVAKLTDLGSTGSFVWAQRAGGMGNEYARTLAVSGSSVYVSGFFLSAMASFGATTLTNAGYQDVFVAKLTDSGSTGSFVWAQQAGGTGDDSATALAVSGTSVYVAGTFSSPTANFSLTTLTNAGNQDVFVARLTDAGSTGSFVWARRAGGTGTEYATSLAVSGTNVYMAGYFGSLTIDFGSITLANAGMASTYDVFAAKLTDVGSMSNVAWAQRAGGTDNDFATALTLSGTNVYVAGTFSSLTANFGPTALSNPNSNSLGYLASLTDPTLTPTVPSRTLAPAQLFPNPARHTATLRLPAGTAPAPMALTDALGRAVRQYRAPVGSEAVLDLQGVPAGLYLLRGAGPGQRLAVE